VDYPLKETPQNLDSEITAVRSRICDWILIAFSLIAGPLIAASIFRIAETGWKPVMAVQMVVIACLWGITLIRHRIPYRFRAFFLIGFILLLAGGGLVTWGLIGGGLLLILSSVTIATILFGNHGALITLSLASTFLILISAAINLDFFQVTIDANAYNRSLISWSATSLSTILLASVAAVGINRLNQVLVDYVGRLKAHEAELETLVEQRTAQLVKSQEGLAKAYDIISSSIDYASNIQHSILPHDDSFSTIFEDYFVIWEPRDRVGGDVYWNRIWGDGVLVILADSTGHGVPGAFMTLIATGGLDRALEEVEPGEVGQLVQRMHQFVQLSLGQHTAGGKSNDGLELGACYLYNDMTQMVFVGARFSLFTLNGAQIEEIKGDKKGIGYRNIRYDQKYTPYTIDLHPGLTIYLTTDGLIDQVGGVRYRMFGKKRFKELILTLRGTELSEQKSEILEALENYQGDETRRDDVSLIGFRVG
jgi:serine phosphatase RsbU (regulator of sigma subunit)